jgi:hypothetical protein
MLRLQLSLVALFGRDAEVSRYRGLADHALTCL